VCVCVWKQGSEVIRKAACTIVSTAVIQFSSLHDIAMVIAVLSGS
jgi:hypothetical protein